MLLIIGNIMYNKAMGTKYLKKYSDTKYRRA